MVFSFIKRQIENEEIWFNGAVITDCIESDGSDLLDEAKVILDKFQLVWDRKTKKHKFLDGYINFYRTYITIDLDKSKFEELAKYLLEHNIHMSFETQEELEEKLVDKLIKRYTKEIQKEVYLCTEVETGKKYITVAKDVEHAYKLLKAENKDLGEVTFRTLTHSEAEVIHIL